MSLSPAAGNLPLSKRPLDLVLALVFLWFAVSSGISDAVATLGIPMTPDSPNPLARANWWYAHDCDPLFMHPPFWMRICTGLSAFVYGPFYLLLSWALIRGWNPIQLPSVVYATLISGLTGIVIFGVEFFGEPEWRTTNPVKFLSFNLPYVIVPLVLLARMRKPLPFQRRF